ncbi:MAG: hypothetical protein AAGC81_01290 [Pseudomonadota bacterium]
MSMSPFRLLATISACTAIALLSFSLLAIPPSYQEVVMILHLAGHGAPAWPEAATDAGAIRAIGAERGALSTATETLMQSQLMPPLWIWAAWLVEALPGGVLLVRVLSIIAIGLSALALWPLFRRVTPHERDHLYLLALFLLIPSTHMAATSVGPDAFAILGLAMALSGASASWRTKRLGLGRAALLGGGAGLASASALIALPAALVILIAGLLALRGAGRWIAIGISLATSLPLMALGLGAVMAYAPEIAAERGIIAPVAGATDASKISIGEALIATHPGRLQPPGLLIILLVGLGSGAVLAGLVGLFRGKKRPEFTTALLAFVASVGIAIALPELFEGGAALIPLAPLVAVFLGTGVLSLETKILAVPLIVLYGFAGGALALTDRGEAHWQLAGEISKKRDILDAVVIDEPSTLRATALPYLMALRLRPDKRVVIGDASEILSDGGPRLERADIAHVVHPPGKQGAERLEAFRTQFPNERQRLLDIAAFYTLLQLGLDHNRDLPDGSAPEQGSD